MSDIESTWAPVHRVYVAYNYRWHGEHGIKRINQAWARYLRSIGCRD